MPSWWRVSSSKDAKKKTSKDSIIDTIRKFRISSDKKSGGSRRGCSDTVSEIGSLSRIQSRSVSPSKESKLVARCQSFQERPQAQPLPLPVLHPSRMTRTESGLSVSGKQKQEKGSKTPPFLPLPHMRTRPDAGDFDGADSVFSECYSDSDDPPDSSQLSPLASDYDTGSRTTAGSPSNMIVKDQLPVTKREVPKPHDHLFDNHISSSPPRRKPLRSHVPNLQVPSHGAFFSAPDSSISSPSRSPLRAFGTEQVINSAFYTSKPNPDFPFLGSGSGHCSSPGSGQNSGHNSMGGDMAGLFWQPSRGSPECSPLPSPKMTSPGPSSRIHSGAVTPLHPRAGGGADRSEDVKQKSHRLPLPPVVTISNSLPFSQSNSAATSPSVPRSPGRPDNLPSPGSRWKKGKLLGRGSFGHVYVGFNSESGEMCAMKEVTLFSDDAKSKESARQLGQEVSLLSRLSHPNIVQYYGSEMVDDKLYIYLEYVSGGSIYKLLQEYGQFGELAIRSYTQQILSGLAYLHAKHTIHRDIKGANILVDPNGRVKLADFGMAKHITGQTCPLSFKGSPYWMAPEIIKNSNGSNLAVDIWSLGCTVLEMATTKPPWSQYEGVAALFKIGNSKELPVIPDHLSDEGKDFVRQCLQRNPQHRPTAAQLLDHSFVKNAAPLERPLLPYPYPEPSSDPNGGIGHPRNRQLLDSDRLVTHSFRASRPGFGSSDVQIPRNISCPVSPIGSPLLHSRSPQHQHQHQHQHVNGRMSPSPISSPRTTQAHRETDADITVAALPMDEKRATAFGLMKIDEEGRIIEFSEKPKGDKLQAMKVDTTILGLDDKRAKEMPFIASMGIYVFSKNVMLDLLREKFPGANDFGSEVIPGATSIGLRVQAYLYDGYWEDIGTIEAFYHANLGITKKPVPDFSFYDRTAPIYTQPRYLPPSKMLDADVTNSVIGEGCVIKKCKIHHSVVGLRSCISEGVIIEDTLLMGADYYETDADKRVLEAKGGVPIGIGKNTHIKKAIIDKNARIGDNVQIINKNNVEEAARETNGYFIKSGIVTVMKDAVIPSGTVI